MTMPSLAAKNASTCETKCRSFRVSRSVQSIRSFEMSYSPLSTIREKPFFLFRGGEKKRETYDFFGRPERCFSFFITLPYLKKKSLRLIPARYTSCREREREKRDTHLVVLDREQDESRARFSQDGFVSIRPDPFDVADEPRVAVLQRCLVLFESCFPFALLVGVVVVVDSASSLLSTSPCRCISGLLATATRRGGRFLLVRSRGGGCCSCCC